MKQKSDLTQFRTEIVIVFIFLGSIGFPGTYRQIFGGFIETLYEYLSFLMQIVIMLTSSGETVMDVKLLDMKPKYRAIYQFMIFTFAAFCDHPVCDMAGGAFHAEPYPETVFLRTGAA